MLISCLVVGLFFSSKSFAVQVITHTSLPVESLTTTQLRRIYSMRQVVWPSGQSIIVYALPKSHPSHQSFSKKTLKIFPYQLDRIWNKLIFSGAGKKPIIVASQEELLRAVQTTKGAIGYVENMEIKDIVNVVKIDG